MGMHLNCHINADECFECKMEHLAGENTFLLRLRHKKGLNDIAIFASPESLLKIADRIYAEFSPAGIEFQEAANQ